MTRNRRAATAALLSLLASTIAVLGSAAPASAAAPVTVDDAVSAYAGSFVDLSPLENDSDADGDELAVCRVADSDYKKVDILVSDNRVLIVSAPGTRAKTYTFTYYACDFETLVPGTISLTIRQSPNITAKALPGQPGKIKVKNPANFKIRFLYGSFREEEPDGSIAIARQSSVILRVRRTQIDWIAFSPRNGFSTMGHVRDIKLPKGTTPPVTKRVSARIAKLWQT